MHHDSRGTRTLGTNNMSAVEQDLLSESTPLQRSWVASARAGVSETMTPAAGTVLGPERREITLQVSAALFRQPWFRPTLDRMLGFLSLGEDWNGYGERPIHESAVKRAVDALNEICPDGPSPCVVPTPDGGVQIEWMTGGFEIEVEIPPSGPALVLIVDPSGQEIETTANARSGTWELLRDYLSRMQLMQQVTA